MASQIPSNHLHRFYEPLILLHTLGQTRGEHTSKQKEYSPDLSLLSISTRDQCRNFLSDLAYVCDYDKGGDTVTAIGLEFTPERNIFWVAANENPARKVQPFLRWLIGCLVDMSILAASEGRFRQLQSTLEQTCAKFASPKIKKYRKLLLKSLKNCESYASLNDLGIRNEISRWILKVEQCVENPLELCQFCFTHRRSAAVTQFLNLGQECSHQSDRDSLQSSFADARHYIGRLAHHSRACTNLGTASRSMSMILHDSTVKSVPHRSSGLGTPPVRSKTRLDSMIVRMLPSESPDLDQYLTALAEMDRMLHLNERFKDTYKEGNFHPRVHAEIQVLEHFHNNKLRFVENDRYVACSKPACFCCQLYFRHHPGNFVQPESHRKVYTNWAPPEVHVQNHTRDILNKMVVDIRKEVLDQIDQRARPPKWHPDSVTGITISVDEINCPKILDQIQPVDQAISSFLTHTTNRRAARMDFPPAIPTAIGAEIRSEMAPTPGDSIDRIQFEPPQSTPVAIPMKKSLSLVDGAEIVEDISDDECSSDVSGIGGVSLAGWEYE